METVSKVTKGLALIVFAAFSVSAYAVPITGHLSMGGSFQLIDSSGTVVGLENATGIDFSPEGSGGDFVVVGKSGDFESVSLWTVGTITDFQFDSFSGPIIDFWTLASDGFSFDLVTLDSVVTDTVNGSDFISLTGSGIINSTMAGLDPTEGIWTLSGDSSTGVIFAWSSTTTATASVPEPTILALMGAALLGLGVVRIRKAG